MSVTPQQFQEMERRVTKTRAPIPDPEASRAAGAWPWPILPLQAFTVLEFDYAGTPVGKPRMSQRDKWRKRPVVLRYRAFADGLRAAAGPLPAQQPDAVFVTALISMPMSWSKKKQLSMNGKPCRSRPDIDNIIKAIADSLFDEDCCIWLALAVKYWCLAGGDGLNVKVLYAKPG